MRLPIELSSIHPVFHVSIIKKCIGDTVSILPIKGIGLDNIISYEDVPVDIRDRQVKKLSKK